MKSLEVAEIEDGATIIAPRSDVIDMTKPWKRLKEMEVDPSNEDHLQSFCGLLAERFGHHQLLPVGFVMSYTLLLHDLRSSRNGFTGEPILSHLSNQPPLIYEMFRAIYIPSIIRTIFEPEDAEAIFAVIKKIDEKAK